MTENGDVNSRASFEAAVRSFTDAEVALGEFVTAAQRFRSASDSLERAQAGLELTREPVLESLETLKLMAAELERTSASMGSTAEVLAQLDPNRFWSSFSEVQGAVTVGLKAGSDEHADLQRLVVHARTASAAASVLAAASFGGVVLLLLR